MPELQEFEVRLSNGLKGTVLRTSRFLDKREFQTVKLSNGSELTVPSSALQPQQDGSFTLRHAEDYLAATGLNGADSAQPAAMPATLSVSGDEISIDAALLKEDIEMEHVPINRVLLQPVAVRVEDGVTIIPVMEEVLKVEKQLILREEIHIRKKQTMIRGPRVVSLRKDAPSGSSPATKE